MKSEKCERQKNATVPVSVSVGEGIEDRGF